MPTIIKKSLIFLLAAMIINSLLLFNTSLDIKALLGLNIFFFAVFLWSTEIIHSTLTALIVFCLISGSGILSSHDSFQVMGDPIIWRLWGIFVLTKGMETTGLARRIAIKILGMAKGNLYSLLMMMEIISFMFVFLVPAVVARTAILASVCLGLVQKLDNGSDKNFAKAVSIIIPVTSLVTSNTVIVGASAIIYAAGYLEKNLHYKVTYLSWLKSNLPPNLLFLVVIYFIIIKLFPFDYRLKENDQVPSKDLQELGKISWSEWKMIICMGLLFISWLTSLDNKLPVEFIAGSLLFIPKIGVLDRRKSFKTLDWESIILFGSGLVMAEALNKTGAVSYLVQNLTWIAGLNETIAVIGIVLITVIVRLGMANMTGVMATLLPVFTSLSTALGYNPVWANMICIMASGLGILIPSQASSVLITYSYGYYNSADMFKTGILVIICYTIILILTSNFYWPYLGLHAIVK